MISPHGSVFDRTGLTPADGHMMSPPLKNTYDNNHHHHHHRSNNNNNHNNHDDDDHEMATTNNQDMDFNEFDESMLSISPSLFISPKLACTTSQLKPYTNKSAMKKLVSPTRIFNLAGNFTNNDDHCNNLNSMASPDRRGYSHMKGWLESSSKTNNYLDNHNSSSDEGLNVLADECISMSASAKKLACKELSIEARNMESPPKMLRIEDDTDLNLLRSPQPELHQKSKLRSALKRICQQDTNDKDDEFPDRFALSNKDKSSNNNLMTSTTKSNATRSTTTNATSGDSCMPPPVALAKQSKTSGNDSSGEKRSLNSNNEPITLIKRKRATISDNTTNSPFNVTKHSNTSFR